jgi:hypothetical protein
MQTRAMARSSNVHQSNIVQSLENEPAGCPICIALDFRPVEVQRERIVFEETSCSTWGDEPESQRRDGRWKRASLWFGNDNLHHSAAPE